MNKFGPKHYVPILKWKRGEQVGLGFLIPSIKEVITPLLEIMPPAWDWDNDRPKKSIDDHLVNMSETIFNSWGKIPVFLDMLWINDSEGMADGTHPLKYIIDQCRIKGLHVIPVTGYDRDDDYNKAVKEAHSTDNFGVCLRLDDDAFLDVSSNILNFLKEFNLSPTQVDLILDLRSITQDNEKLALISATTTINIIPHLGLWRTLTIASTSFPQNLSGVAGDSIGFVPRTEWSIWQNLVTSGKIKRPPSFGDYGISHPDYSEINPKLMRMSANIRYTLDNQFALVKGENVKKNGYGQFQDLCKKILSRPFYSGKSFSWGDNYIYDCANGTCSTGSAETWRRVGTNHHITLVANQVSSFSGI